MKERGKGVTNRREADSILLLKKDAWTALCWSDSELRWGEGGATTKRPGACYEVMHVFDFSTCLHGGRKAHTVGRLPRSLVTLPFNFDIAPNGVTSSLRT